MTKRKGTKQAALVDCIKHLQEEGKIATLWELRDELPFFHDNVVTKNMYLSDLYTVLYKIGVSTGLCEVRWDMRWSVYESTGEHLPSLMTTAEYHVYRRKLPDGHQERGMNYRAAVFILASAEHYQKRMDAKKASLAKRKKKQEDKTPVPIYEKSFYDRVAKRSAILKDAPRFSYDTPVVEDGAINMPQLPTSQEVYNAKTDAEIDQQLEDFFTDESPTTENKPTSPAEESNTEPTGGEPLKILHIDMSYTRIAICIATGIFVGMTASNLITSLFI